MYNRGVKYSNLPVPKKIPFTKEGFEKNKKDNQILLEKRKEILVRLQRAREMGDLSENGAYKAARFELSATDRELRRLKYLLRFGVVTEKKNNERVDFGSTVTVFDGKEKFIFTIVSGYESNPTSQKLSVESPIGKALIGKRAGEKIFVNTPEGVNEYNIVKIE